MIEICHENQIDATNNVILGCSSLIVQYIDARKAVCMSTGDTICIRFLFDLDMAAWIEATSWSAHKHDLLYGDTCKFVFILKYMVSLALMLFLTDVFSRAYSALQRGHQQEIAIAGAAVRRLRVWGDVGCDLRWDWVRGACENVVYLAWCECVFWYLSRTLCVSACGSGFGM